MKRIICLVLFATPFLVTGCVSNPSSEIAGVQKAASAPIAAAKEIIFPSQTEAITVPIHNGDVKRARMEAVSVLVGAMKEKCQWKKPMDYYGDKVTIEAKSNADAVYVRAHMNESLCPEK